MAMITNAMTLTVIFTNGSKNVARVVTPVADVELLEVSAFRPANGAFHKWGYPQMDGLQWKILLKWMI